MNICTLKTEEHIFVIRPGSVQEWNKILKEIFKAIAVGHLETDSQVFDFCDKIQHVAILGSGKDRYHQRGIDNAVFVNTAKNIIWISKKSEFMRKLTKKERKNLRQKLWIHGWRYFGFMP